jgi:uncharacterized coiled-coil protein SlyX
MKVLDRIIAVVVIIALIIVGTLLGLIIHIKQESHLQPVDIELLEYKDQVIESLQEEVQEQQMEMKQLRDEKFELEKKLLDLKKLDRLLNLLEGSATND